MKNDQFFLYLSEVIVFIAPVAQLDRASAYEAGG